MAPVSSPPLPIPVRAVHSSRYLRAPAHLLGVLLLGAGFMIGCGEPERESADRWSGGGSSGLGGQTNVISVGTCSDGTSDERPCKVYHHQASGVTSCFNGIQYCDDGQWSDCVEENPNSRVP